MKTFQFLYKQILEQVIMIDAKKAELESGKKSDKVIGTLVS